MTVQTHNPALDALKLSLAAAMPTRTVQRSLIDPASASDVALRAGVVCLVAGGGGDFATYVGRECELGTMDVQLACFVLVANDAPPEEVERAELTLLGEVLEWAKVARVPGVDSIYPTRWKQSGQLEAPYGWLVLGLDVKT